jgi:secreted trypsin-like serine protease
MRARRIAIAITVAILTSLLIGGLNPVPAAAVAHGTPAAAGQHPYAVRLLMTNIPRPDGTTYASACSAALISPTWIITAGHCFHDVNRNRVSGPVPYPTSATLNTANLATSPGETRSVVEVRQTAVNDVALARLSAPVTDVRPLALATARPAAGQLLTIAGWGATSSVNPVPSNQLNTGVVKISNVSGSTVLVRGYSPGTDTSACLYDSGAPYMSTPPGAAPRLVSVESTGPNCPHTLSETTARVDVLVPWIRTVVRDLPAG